MNELDYLKHKNAVIKAFPKAYCLRINQLRRFVVRDGLYKANLGKGKTARQAWASVRI